MKKPKIEKHCLAQKFKSFNTVWQPHILAEINGSQIRLDKMIGPFFWQQHESQEVIYLIHKGSLIIQRDKQPDIRLEAGEMISIPKGTRYRLASPGIAEVIIFCPDNTINTGDQQNEFTRQPHQLKHL